jgi:3-oxoacyl-[acyl-carrier protein] reductase
MADRLKGQASIVTGAGKGIGRAIAQVFAAEGARVLVADVDEESARATAADLERADAEAVAVRVDISRGADAAAMARAGVERFGRIDVLCQNAGIYPEVRIADMTEADWDRVHAINLKGTFLTVKACLPQMIRQGYGRIVITSSITGPRTGNPGLAHYAATKAGINGFIRTAAIEFASHGITINAVEPGNIMAPGMEDQLGADYIRAQEQSIPMGKLGEPEDIGYAMLFLAGDEAKYITGQTIVVDGGQTLPESRFAVS